MSSNSNSSQLSGAVTSFTLNAPTAAPAVAAATYSGAPGLPEAGIRCQLGTGADDFLTLVPGELSDRQQKDFAKNLREYLATEAKIDLSALPLNLDHCLLSGSVVTRIVSGLKFSCNDVDVYCHASVYAATREAFVKAHPQHISFAVSDEKGHEMMRLCHRPDVYRTDKRIESVETFKWVGYSVSDGPGDCTPTFQLIVIRDNVGLQDLIASFDLSVSRNWSDGGFFHVGDVPGTTSDDREMRLTHRGDMELLKVWCDPQYTSLMARTAAAQTVVLKHYKQQFKHYNFITNVRNADGDLALDLASVGVGYTGLYHHLMILVERITKYDDRGFKLIFIPIAERILKLGMLFKTVYTPGAKIGGDIGDINWYESWLATFAACGYAHPEE